MDCSFKLNENVHIGRSIRKTKGNDTIPYHNLPITNAKIIKFDNLGFTLSHPNFGRDVYLEFQQLPLMDIKIENGVILDEIVFVEHLFRAGGTQMFLQKTDTAEYRDLVKDQEFLDSTDELIKLKDLKPGQIVTPGTCKEGANFTFIGIFHIRNISLWHNWRAHASNNEYKFLIPSGVKRAIFVFDNDDGKKEFKDYPVGNKIIKELFDTGQVDKNFTSAERNLTILQNLGEDNTSTILGEFFIKYDSSLHQWSDDKNRHPGYVHVDNKKITDKDIEFKAKELSKEIGYSYEFRN